MSIFKKKVVFEVDAGPFNDFIKEQFGNSDYMIEAAELLADDQVWSGSVGPDSWQQLDEWQREDIASFREGEWREHITSGLLQDLFERGVIEEGEYLVRTY